MSLPKGIGLGLHWAWVPLFGFIFGCATIIALLVIWLAQGHPRYTQDESTVVYISDVGPGDNHALFIVPWHPDSNLLLCLNFPGLPAAPHSQDTSACATH